MKKFSMIKWFLMMVLALGMVCESSGAGWTSYPTVTTLQGPETFLTTTVNPTNNQQITANNLSSWISTKTTNNSSQFYKFISVWPENLDNGDYLHSIGFKVSMDGINWQTLYNRTTNYNPSLFCGAPSIWYHDGKYIVSIDSSIHATNDGYPQFIIGRNTVTVTISTNLINWTPPQLITVPLPGTTSWGMYGSEYFVDGTNQWLIIPAVERDNGNAIRDFAVPVDLTGTNFVTSGVVDMFGGSGTYVDSGRPFKLATNKYIFYGTRNFSLYSYQSTNPTNGYTLLNSAINSGWVGATSLECPLMMTNPAGGYILYAHPNPGGFGRVVYALSSDGTNWNFKGDIQCQANSSGRISAWELDASAQKDVENILAANTVIEPVKSSFQGFGATYSTPYYMSGAPSLTKVNYEVTAYASGGGKLIADIDCWIGSTAGSIPTSWSLAGYKVNKLLLPSSNTNGWSATPAIDSNYGLRLNMTSPSSSTVWNVIQSVSESYLDTYGSSYSGSSIADYTPSANTNTTSGVTNFSKLNFSDGVYSTQFTNLTGGFLIQGYLSFTNAGQVYYISCTTNRQVVAATINTNGLLVLYKFAGDTLDYSGNNNNGVATNSPTYVTGQDGITSHAISLNGTSQYVYGPTNLNVTNVTLEAWVKYPAGSGGIVAMKGYNGSNVPYSLDAAPNASYGGIAFFPGWPHSGITTDVRDNTWHFVAGTYDGTNLIYYVDGAANRTNAIAGSGNLPSNAALLYVGYQNSDNVYATGAIQDFRLYNRALTASEILQNYINGPAQ